MATTYDSSTSTAVNGNKPKAVHCLSRSLERALDEATYTGELVLNGRKLREFPNYSYSNNKCDLSDTITADLSRNHFVEFPRILCSFSSLERLNLYSNAIKSIPEQIAQIRLLKVLDLSRNQLAYIPSSLCKLPNLEVLIINNNKLLSLPEEIGQLERLIELDVSSNDINQIPYQIGTLTSLRTLNIRRNMIRELPAGKLNSFDFFVRKIGHLKLINFDCSFNRLTRLPLNLREMVTLIEFNVEHNPLESPPASVCTLGLLHIMRYLLVEAMREEKRRGLLTENEINSKYRNSFSYQGARHLQCGTRLRKTVVPSDSGYLTTESSEKTLGDDDSVISMPDNQSLRSEPTLMLTLADEFSKELTRQRTEYDKKKCQAHQLKIHLLQQLGETETQRAKTRELARRAHDEKLAKMEKQREDARRKMENSKNIHLLNFSSKERPWPLTKQFSNDNSAVGDLLLRTNRAISVEPNGIAGGNEMKLNNGHHRHYLIQQKSLPNGSTSRCESSTTINRQFTSSDTINQLKISSSNVNYDQMDDLQYDHYEENRVAKLKYYDGPSSNYDHMSMKTSSMDNSIFSMQRHTFHSKEENIQLEQMKKIIEDRLKVTLPDDIAYALSDGVVLCHFINQIRPRSVQSIHVPSQAVPKLSIAKCRRNVENFIEASRRIGVPEHVLDLGLITLHDFTETKLTKYHHRE
ncbi:unnamed protein product [Adineta ricciae]|uniref:Calponin-homology (CH) domain-containing protein n=1 Tax=Adineta ricciae TaxID=249248 RepID=A0A814KQ42_ADIRI|nr:unnamed protein product [Adineta ricciae]